MYLMYRQREWWDSLLEVRILLQRLMNAANKLPGAVLVVCCICDTAGCATLCTLQDLHDHDVRVSRVSYIDFLIGSLGELFCLLCACAFLCVSCAFFSVFSCFCVVCCAFVLSYARRVLYPPPAPHRCRPPPGPNELPLFLEGDESLTDLAKEGAGAAQALATQLSALRRSQMACWGVTTTTNDTVGTNGENARNTGPGTAMEQGEGGGEGAEAVAAREHGSCMEWWEGVLGRWHERTQLVDPSLQKKFRVVNQGPWAQVTASLADRGRANRRAFMAESEVRLWLCFLLLCSFLLCSFLCMCCVFELFNR